MKVQRLSPPSLNLQSYGGGELDLVSEIRCRVSRGSYSTEAVLQVQKGAPVKVLLGTDLQPHLGFMFIQLNGEDCGVNLLPLENSTDRGVVTLEVGVPTTANETDQSVIAGDPCQPMTVGESEGSATVRESEGSATVSSSATVCLLHATRVPSRHSKLVRAQIRSSQEVKSLALFEPAGTLSEKGLSMTDAAVEPRPDQSLTLLVENESCQPVWLKKGQVLGQVEPAHLVEWPVEPDIPAEVEVRGDPERVEVRSVQTSTEETTSQQQNRGELLLSMLGFTAVAESLSEEEEDMLPFTAVLEEVPAKDGDPLAVLVGHSRLGHSRRMSEGWGSVIKLVPPFCEQSCKH